MAIHSEKRSCIDVGTAQQISEVSGPVMAQSWHPLQAPAGAMLLIALLLCVVSWSRAQVAIDIKEYPVGFPFDITAGPDGAMWFTNYTSIGRISSNGTVTTYPLPNQGKEAGRITSGPDGALWFTEGYPDAIGRITTDGSFTEYPLPNPASGVRGITKGPDGALWFTEWSGGKIGRITTSGIITEYQLPRRASTDWITAGPDGAVWFTEENDGGYVGRITTNGTITEYLLPPPIADWVSYGFTGITAGPDGALWITEWVGHRILRLTTTGSVTAYNLAGCPTETGICADGITVGPDGALWFTMFTANSIGRITTAGVVTQYPIPTSNSQSSGIATGPDGSVWFVEHAAGKIGRVLLSKSATSIAFISNLNPSTYGQPVTWMAKVSSLRSVVPTGNVAFRWSRDGQTYTIGTAPLNTSGVAMLTRSNLNTDPFGAPYPLVAVYSGDTFNLGSTSAVLLQDVLQTKTIASITSSINPSKLGQVVTLTAKITSPTVIVTGPVTFSIGYTNLGTAQLNGGTAKFTTSALPVGASRVKVTYYGNSNVAKSSASILQTVQYGFVRPLKRCTGSSS